MAQNSVPKSCRNSAAISQPINDQLENKIREELQAIPLPPHPFITQGIAETTLDDVSRLLDVLNVMDLRAGYEMPEGGESALCDLKASLIAAVRYSQALVDCEDEMRGAGRRQAVRD